MAPEFLIIDQMVLKECLQIGSVSGRSFVRDVPDSNKAHTYLKSSLKTVYYLGLMIREWNLLGGKRMIKNKLFAAILVIMFGFSLSAQAQFWVNTGELTGATYVSALIETADSTIYAGTYPDGNVFKTINGGANWTNTGPIAAGYIMSLLGSSDGAIYAGTYLAAKVFKTTDDGNTWTATGDLSGDRNINALVEESDGAIYAANNKYVYKTVNGGDTWTNTGELIDVVMVYSLLETADGSIYAGTYNYGDIFKTTDGGTTWNNTGDLAGASIVFSMIEASDGAIYAGTMRSSQIGDVHRSTDGGATWTNTGVLSGVTKVAVLLEAANGVIYAGTAPNGEVFKTNNGGTSWVTTGDLSGASLAESLLEASDGYLYVGTQLNGDVFKSESPTSIELISFMAESLDDAVLLSWETASEKDNAGFHLYRADSANGDYVKVTSDLLPSQGDEFTGASYEFTDGDVKAGNTYYYKLEDIDLSGRSSFHGPINVTLENEEPLFGCGE